MINEPESKWRIGKMYRKGMKTETISKTFARLGQRETEAEFCDSLCIRIMVFHRTR
jgi:hypothetical protein